MVPLIINCDYDAVLDRQWTILVIMHCSGLDKVFIMFLKGFFFYKISYALCTYVSSYGFFIILKLDSVGLV